jgi:hypothetical protein
VGLLAFAVAVPMSFRIGLFLYLPPLLEFVPYSEGNAKLGRYLAENRSSDTTIAVAAAGAIPFYSGLRTIDMFGLNDPYIAHHPVEIVPLNWLK